MKNEVLHSAVYDYEEPHLFYIFHDEGYRTKRVGFIGDGASKLLAPSPF